jgi:hypothetical protein
MGKQRTYMNKTLALPLLLASPAALANDGVAAVMLFAWLFMVVLALLWLLVPFAIFGIKPLLRSILAEMVKARADRERG